MSKELVIASNRHETKVGVLEDDQLVEVFFQRANEYSLAGSIHKGRVTRVLPGMQSAFVDLGLERDTFLYVSDFFEEHSEDFDDVSDAAPIRTQREAGPSDREAAGPENRDRGIIPDQRDQRGGRDRGGRDRGGRDRGPRPDRGRFEPQRQAPSTGLPEAAPVFSAPIPEGIAPVESIPEELFAAPIIEAGAPQTSAPPIGVSQENRPFGDRDRGGDRGGDRRRRSRRRRTRGQGFPDNKYAQPGATPSPVAPQFPTPASEAAPEEEETEAREIILLPGESLAKYRNAPMAAPVKAAAEIHVEISTEFPSEIDEPADFEDDIDDDATGFVAGTHDREIESSEEEHEALTQGEGASIHPEHETLTASVEEVSHRQALTIEPPATVTPVVSAGPAAVPLKPEVPAEPQTQTPFRSATPSYEREQREHEVKLAAQLLDELRGDKVEPEIADDEDLEVPAYLEEELADAETVFPDTLEAGEGEAFEGDESAAEGESVELEAAVGESIEPAEPLDPNAVPPPHQAVVREQGNRAPHRMGRRMRRRRGGRGGGQYSNGAAAPQGPAPATAEGGVAEARPEARVEVQFESEFLAESRPEARVEQRGERPREDRPRPDSGIPSITDLLKPGQEIIVQIAKEPLGQKGARITSHIALPGRYVVFMPSIDHLGVSRKIASDEERLRLKRILQTHRVGTSGGFICRTAGEGRTEDEIAADMSFLYNLWLDIRQKAEKKPAPALLHHDLDVVQRILRDQLTDEYKAIWVDNEDLYESALRFVQRFQPALVGRVKMYTRSAPIFDAFGITQELEKALRPKVWLKSGGYIVINQTEALVAIDVNTGKYVGKSNRLEDTIVKTNTEAVKEIVRQVRLRDLGGIIVVDFIDMDERKNRQKVMGALEDAMRADKAPYKILQFNDFGLVAITRKRVKQSLERTLCAPCPYCEGAGYVKSVQTIIGEILIEAQKIAKAVEGKDVMLRVHPDVAKVLKSNNNQYLEELEEILGRPVLVAGDAALHHEKFDLG